MGVQLKLYLLILFTWNPFIAICQFPFKDVAQEAGITGENPGFYGVAIGDCNNDGYEDLFITTTREQPRLYINQRDNTYLDYTLEAGINFPGKSKTSIWIDINNDDWLDLFIAGKGTEDQLYENQRDGAFTDVSESYGLRGTSTTFSLNIAQINEDPFLDIYLSNFLEENTLWLNEGESKLRNRINFYELWDNGLSMASIFFDYDNDGDDDLYLVHDANHSNILYERKDGTYVDVSEVSGANIAADGMGVDIADINNDGCLDIYITNLFKNNLLLNNCDGTFSDISSSAGVDDNGMGWGTTFIDFDNDGWVDIMVCNDSYFSDYPNVLYRNNGDLTFTPIEMAANNPRSGSYGCVTTDINLDGKMDLAIANLNAQDNFQLLQNYDENMHNWIGFLLKGKNCNRQGIGSRIELVDDIGIQHTDQVTGGNGYSSQGSPFLHFGLGESGVDEIIIKWADGSLQNIAEVSPNMYYLVEQGDEPVPYWKTTGVINEAKEAVDIQVYPNPVSNHINIRLLNPGFNFKTVALVDHLGRKVLSQPISKREINETLLTLFLPSEIVEGLYYISVRSSEKSFSQKVIITR
jgi:hypothetical protein